MAALILCFMTVDVFSSTDVRVGRNGWTDRELFVVVDNTHRQVRPCAELLTAAVGRTGEAPTHSSLATTHGAELVLQTVLCLGIG